jgi:predicted nucleic acid-binding protein
MVVILDTGVLCKIASPKDYGEEKQCKKWAVQLSIRGARLVTPIICDYEVRRGLLLASFQQNKEVEGVELLNKLEEDIEFLSLTTEFLRKGAQLWAESTFKGIPLTKEQRFDIDILICAHWHILKQDFPGRYTVVATKNIEHIARFAEADEWQNIKL